MLSGREETKEKRDEATNSPPKNARQRSSWADMADRRMALEVVSDLAVDDLLVAGCVR